MPSFTPDGDSGASATAREPPGSGLRVLSSGSKQKTPTTNPQPGTQNPEPSFCPQPGTHNREPSFCPQPGTQNPQPSLPKGQALSAFLFHLQAEGASPLTVSVYARDLDRVLTVLEETHHAVQLLKITQAQLEYTLNSQALTQSRKHTPLAPATRHRQRAAVKSFFTWAHRQGHIADNPATNLKLGRLPRKPPVFLSEGEKKRLLKVMRDRSSPLARRDRVLIEVFLGTGIRLAELASLNTDDVDLDAKHLRVRVKGGEVQVKFLKTDLRILLRRHLKERKHLMAVPGDTEAMFLSNQGKRLSTRQISRRLDEWVSAAGITKHITPHKLRHTFATHLYAKTGNLLLVKRAMGHKDIGSTQVYTHLSDDALEDALEQL